MQRFDVKSTVRIREFERRYDDDPFPPQSQALPARDEHFDVGTGREQLGNDRSGIREMLEVVEDQEHSLRAEDIVESVAKWSRTGILDPDRAGQNRFDQ